MAAIATTTPKESFIETCLFFVMKLFGISITSLTETCLFLFIVLCPIGDFMLQGTPLRSLGMSPAIFPLCALALARSVRRPLAGQRNLSRYISIFFVYVLIISVYGLLQFGMYSHGENLLWKGATSLISLLAVLYATQLDYCKTAIVRPAIYFAFTLVVVGFLFGNSNPLGLPPLTENNVLHFTPLPDERPRGLTREPGHLSLMVLVLGLLSIHLTRSQRGKTLLFLGTCGVLIASGSKGGILTLFICAIILSIMKWHSKWYQVAGLLLVIFPLGLILIWLIPNLFPEESFAFSGTVPTRFSMIICALMTVIHHPFGVGVTGFLPAVAKYLPDAMSDLQSIFPFPLNFSEVAAYEVSSEMVSTKTFFFDQMMRFGVPFVLFFSVFIAGLIKRLVAERQQVLLIAILASVVAIVTYAPGTGNFAVPIAFGVALNEVW